MIIVDERPELMDEGVWTSFGSSEFKVMPASNLKFQRIIGKLSAPFRKKIERGTLDPKISLDHICKALSRAVVVDWRNVGNSAGSAVEFSEELCELALHNNEDLREFIQEFALDLENFKSDTDNELVKA